MARGGLLNPPVEAAACRKMIDHVAEKLRTYERELASVVLDRERYLLLMGNIQSTRTHLQEMRQIYAREFET
jgi:GTP1/Obg family GTP-binding protein